MENDFKKIVCIVCGSGDSRLFTEKNGHVLYKCKTCRSLFVYPPPVDASSVYGADYFLGASRGFGYVDYDRDKSAMEGAFSSYLDIIEKIKPKKGALLDVGAATGFFLKIVRMRGWKVSGIEISDFAASKARRNGIDVQTGTLGSVGKMGKFDVITMLDVCEHYPDPKREILLAKSLLKNEGLLVINTPDSSSFWATLLGKKWHLIVPPEHLVYFNPRSLSGLLEECGFRIVLKKKIGKRFTPQYIFRMLYSWQKISFWKRLSELSDKTFLSKFHIPINLRDNFLIIATLINNDPGN